jgi:hypothetical protein
VEAIYEEFAPRVASRRLPRPGTLGVEEGILDNLEETITLNPLDFYSWGHLKSLVCSSPLDDEEILRNRAVSDLQRIFRQVFGIWNIHREVM